jgi:hypothetical protein
MSIWKFEPAPFARRFQATGSFSSKADQPPAVLDGRLAITRAGELLATAKILGNKF